MLRTWPPLPHTRRSRAHILTASATTIHDKGDGTGSSRLPDCSVFPVNPATEHCDQLPWGPHDRFGETTLVNERTGVSVEMAIRLSKAFGSTPETWLGMQMAYELWQARERAEEIAVEEFAAA